MCCSVGIFAVNILFLLIWAILIRFLPINKFEKDKIYLFVSFLQLFILSVCKDFSVGQDTNNYLYGFNRISELGIKSVIELGWEPGYVILNIIIDRLGLGFRGLIVIISLFTYFSFYIFIKKYSPIKWLSVILFVAFGYYYGTLHILRQTVALSIILYSYDYIICRNTRRFIFCVLMAASFHYTAILFLFTYFFWSNKRLTLTKFTIIYLICYLVGAILINFLLNTALGIVARYEEYKIAAVSGEGYGMLILLLCITLIGLALPRKGLFKRGILLYLLMGMATCLQLFTISFSLFARICWYWNIAIIAFIPLIIGLIGNKKAQLILKIGATVFAFVFFFLISNSLEGIEEYATYKFME